jgi:hypothetical protein
MTEDEIIKMLRASCNPDIVDPWRDGFWVILTEELKDFAKLIAQHEREACAKVCDKYAGPFNAHRIGECADAIRARGQA